MLRRFFLKSLAALPLAKLLPGKLEDRPEAWRPERPGAIKIVGRPRFKDCWLILPDGSRVRIPDSD